MTSVKNAPFRKQLGWQESLEMPRLMLVFVGSLADEYGADLPDIARNGLLQCASHGLRSMLLFSSGNFMQAMEGRAPAVLQAYAAVQRDCRNLGVQILLREECLTKHGVTTSLGTTPLAPAVRALLPAELPIFPLCAKEIELRTVPGKARILLTQFATS